MVARVPCVRDAVIARGVSPSVSPRYSRRLTFVLVFAETDAIELRQRLAYVGNVPSEFVESPTPPLFTRRRLSGFASTAPSARRVSADILWESNPHGF